MIGYVSFEHLVCSLAKHVAVWHQQLNTLSNVADLFEHKEALQVPYTCDGVKASSNSPLVYFCHVFAVVATWCLNVATRVVTMSCCSTQAHTVTCDMLIVKPLPLVLQNNLCLAGSNSVFHI